MPYKNPEEKRAVDRRNAKRKRKRRLTPLSSEAQQLMFVLYDATHKGEVILDIEELPHTPGTLGNLVKRKFIRRVDQDLWRITLGGMVHMRNTYSVI